MEDPQYKALIHAIISLVDATSYYKMFYTEKLFKIQGTFVEC